MKLQNKINFFLFFISIISLSTFKNVNASLQDQYRNQTCTWDNAPFQDSDYDDLRYCINKNNGRVTFIYDDGLTDYEQGYVGRSESVRGDTVYGGVFIYEWVINSNELIQYSCMTDDWRNCSTSVEIEKKAYKR